MQFFFGGVYLFCQIPERELTEKDINPQVFADYEENVVQFDNIDYWYENDENTVTFRVSPNVLRNKDDWIGVFEVNKIIYLRLCPI